jgi:hypothetical protein
MQISSAFSFDAKNVDMGELLHEQIAGDGVCHPFFLYLRGGNDGSYCRHHH